MKLFQLFFRTTDKEFSPDRYYIKLKKNSDKVYLDKEKGLLVIESDIKKWWEEGGGILSVEYAGELDDKLFQPVLAEPDFIDSQIRSKHNAEILGYQG